MAERRISSNAHAAYKILRGTSSGSLLLLLAMFCLATNGLPAEVSFVVSPSFVAVSELGTQAVKIWLSSEPEGNVSGTLAWIDGDSDLSVDSGSPFVISKADWQTGVSVVLSATGDADTRCATATFRIEDSTTGAAIASRDITAMELDDDGGIAVGGEIAAGTVWDNTQDYYWITSTVTIPATGGLSIQPGVVVRRASGGNYHNFIVSGTLEAATDSVLLLNTYTYPYTHNEYYSGITIQNGGIGRFRQSKLLAREGSSRWTNSRSEWVHLLSADASSEIELYDCLVESINTVSDYRAGFGLYINGATTTIVSTGSTGTAIRGFRWGIYQVFGAASQEIDVCDFENINDADHVVNGNAYHDVALKNADMYITGTVKVHPGVTMTLPPESGLYRWKDQWFIVDGGTLIAQDASFGAATFNYPVWNAERRDGISFQNGAKGTFERCYLYGDDSQTRGDLNDWVALLVADSSSELVLKGCSLESRNLAGHRTGFGVRLNGAKATIIADGTTPTSFKGFRTGIYQIFGEEQQRIEPCLITDCDYVDYLVNGDVVRAVTLENEGMHVLSTVQVLTGGVLTLAPGSDLYRALNKWLIVDGGQLIATDAAFGAVTRNYPPGYSERRHGIYFQNGSRGIFQSCQLYSDEYDERSAIGDWVAILYADDSSELTAQGCSFVSRNTAGKRTGYGIHIDGATATLIADGTTPNSFQGFRCGMALTFGPGSWQIDACSLSGNEHPAALWGTASHDYDVGPNSYDLFYSSTVASGARVTFPEDSMFYSYSRLLTVESGGGLTIDNAEWRLNRGIQTYGTVAATDTLFLIDSRAYPNTSERYNGFDLYDGSDGTFTRCSFQGRETRTTGSSGDWSAVFYLGADASLTASDCFFRTRWDTGYYTRYIVRSWSQRQISLSGCSFLDNYYAFQLDAFPSTSTLVNNDFMGNSPYAIYNASQITLDALQNWWDSASGPTHIENPGGTGDPVSDYVDYGQSLLAVNREPITLDHPWTGQESSNLTLDATQTSVELVGFRVDPGQSQIEQLGFRFSNLSGIAWSDLSNFKLVSDANGNGNADASEVASAVNFDESSSSGSVSDVLFKQSFETSANSAQGYILVADITQVADGDAFTVDVNPFEIWSTPGTPIQSQVGSVRHVAGAAVNLANPAGGQVGDNLSGYSRQSNVVLYGFRLLGEGDETSQTLEFTLSGVSGLSRATITSAGLYTDEDGDGQLDAADSRIGSPTEILMSGSTGSIAFAEALELDASYLLVASFRGLSSGAQLTVQLSPENIEMASGSTVLGSADPATHVMDPAYLLSQNENWSRPTDFGQFVDQADFPLLGIRILPLGRTVNTLTVDLSSAVGVQAGDITNPTLYWDKNDDGVLDAGDEVFAGGTVDLSGQQGTIEFKTPFTTRGSLLIVADFTSLANGDEITVSMSSSDLTVPSGYGVTGAIPAIRYVAQTGMPDYRSKNMSWTLTYRSPGGNTVNGRYNPAGDKVILGYNTGSAWVYEATTNTPLLMLKEHYDQVEYAGFSKGGTEAITVSRDGAVYIWDASTGAQRSAMFSDLLVTYAVPSPDLGKLMVITEGKGILLDIENERRLWEYIPGNYTVNAIAYSPDGQYILVGSSDFRAYLLDAETGVEVRRYIGHTETVTGVSFIGDGSRIMTGSTDAVVQIWETDNGNPLGGPPLMTISLDSQDSQGAAVSLDGNRVAMVTGTGKNAQLRMFNEDGLELYAIDLDDESGGRWGGTLENLTFDHSGERVLVTSRGSDWAKVASFRTDNGDFILSWGPEGLIKSGLDARPRISDDGERIFFSGNRGFNVLFRTPGKLMLRSPNMPSNKGFDISEDGSRVAWFEGSRLRIDTISEQGFTTFLDRDADVSNYNVITMSDSGDMVIAGDRLFNGRTGALMADYASEPDINARSAFSPNGRLWGFVMSQAMVSCRTDDPNAVLYNLMLTDPYAPYKMFYHPDEKRIACVDSSVGVQMYDMTTDLPVGLYRFSGNSDAVLSEDGTLLLIGGGNVVHLHEVRTGRILRFFYPQHSGLQSVSVRAVQFANHDNLILIAWSNNYVETYERSQPTGLEISPAHRVLAASESQTFRVTVVYDNGVSADVTPSSATDAERATLQIDPPSMATVDGNIVTVNDGAVGTFTVQARYRESGTSFIAEATVTVGESHLTELVANPSSMSVVPGVFRDLAYRARYDDGYETIVTSQVDLSASPSNDVTIAGQSVKVNLTALPGDIVVTGTYTDYHGDIAAATTTIHNFGLKTQWERYRVTGGGYGLSGDWSPDKGKLAWGSSSGAVSIYNVGLTPSQYALGEVFIAHDGPIIFIDYLSDTGLITVSQEGTIKTWDLVYSATEPLAVYYHDAPILAAARSGAKVAFTDNLGKVAVYDYSNDQLDWALTLHDGAAKAVAVDVDTVLSGGDDWRVKVLQRSDGTVLKSILTHTAPIVAVGYLGTSSFYTVSEDQTATFWNKTNYQVLTRYEYPVTPTSAEVIGSEFFVSTMNPVATWVYNFDGLLLRWLDHPPDQGVVGKYLIDPSGKYLLTGRKCMLKETAVSGAFGDLGATEQKPSPFSSFQFWEVGRGIYRGSLAHSYALTNAHVADDTTRIITQDSKRTMKWTFAGEDVTSASSTRLMETGYFLNYDFSGLDFNADSSILATRVGISIYLYNTVNDLLWKTMHTPGAGPFAISPGASTLTNSGRMATSDSKTRLWDLADLSQISEESRVSAALDFRLEDDFLGAAGSKFIGIWNSSGMLYNGVQTVYDPVHLFVNSTGSRCAAVTMREVCDMVSCTYYYYLEIFNTSDLSVEPPSVGPPLFLFSTSADSLFGGGEGQVSSSVAVSDDTALALVGSEGDRPVRLISTADGSTIREFNPPSGQGSTNIGSAKVGFADNDGTLMIGWREGFVELYRRVPPDRLSIVVTKTASGKPNGGGAVVFRKVITGEGDIYVKAGDVLDTETIAFFKNGQQLNVTSSATLYSSNLSVAQIEGRSIVIPGTVQDGDEATITVEYEELGNIIYASVKIIVGRLHGDTNEDAWRNYLDLFEFSRWWQQPENSENTLCDEVDDATIDELDLLELMDLWK